MALSGGPAVRDRRNGSRHAFTVTELIVSIVILVVLLAIAIPQLITGRQQANENTAIGNLRALHVAQNTFASVHLVDQDDDDTGEFGLLGELSGEIIPRSRTKRFPRSKAPFPGQFATGGSGGLDGCAVRTEYVYRIYLAASDDGAGDDKTLGGAREHPAPTLADAKAIDLQETRYVTYAWPETVRHAGSRAFAATEKATVYSTAMGTVTYAGRGVVGALNVPAANALTTGPVFSSEPASGSRPGADGNRWRTVGTAD